MAKQVVNNAKLLYSAYDLSGDHNRIALSLKRDTPDSTTFGATARARIAGLHSVELTSDGYWEGGDAGVDDVLFDNLGTATRVLTVSASDGTKGNIAYFCPGVSLSYAPGPGSVGGIKAFTAAAYSEGYRAVRGTILGSGAKTATGNGTAYNLGAASATQYLYGALHCTAASGSGPPGITVKIQSDTAENFPSAEDRISFSALAAIGAQWATPVTGAITDTWWRATWTITGGDPSFTIWVSMGII